MTNLFVCSRNSLLTSLIILLLFIGQTCLAQDSTAFVIHGRVMEKVRNLPVREAEIVYRNSNGITILAVSNDSGYYSMQINLDEITDVIVINVTAKDHIGDGIKIKTGLKENVRLDFGLLPGMICRDTWFPEYFKFELNGEDLSEDDSTYIFLRFSNPEIVEILREYEYKIETRRSSGESGDVELKRGEAVREALIRSGIDPDRITIESKSTEDFFYCMYCEGCVYEFQYGQGIDVTEELIKNTTDLLKKEEYESMRRVVQIKMSRYLNNK